MSDNFPIHPLQALVDGYSAAMQKKRADEQLTLGGLIKLLDALPPNAIVVGFGEAMSYRGYYSDLAFEPSDAEEAVAALLARARSCMGQTFQGYKGGNFMMGDSTPLWSSRYGTASGLKIVSLEEVDGKFAPTVELETWD